MKLTLINPEQRNLYEVPLDDLDPGEWFHWAYNVYVKLGDVDRPEAPHLCRVLRITNAVFGKVERTLNTGTQVQPIRSKNIIIELENDGSYKRKDREVTG